MAHSSRRQFLAGSAAAFTSALLLKSCTPNFSQLDRPAGSGEDPQNQGTAADGMLFPPEIEDDGTLRIGLLHSLSGSLAMSEAGLVEGAQFAIDEINAAGGLLGKTVVPLVEDGASDPPTFAERAEKLLGQKQVAALFGGYTTASRRAMLPALKTYDRLLWYPGPYEGQECDRNIFYLGPTANQQLEPAVNWMLGNRGKTFFLLSNGDRTNHDIAREIINQKGGKVAGEAAVPLTSGRNIDMAPVLQDIQTALPEGGIILNTLVGTANRLLFQGMESAGLSASKYIVQSLRLSEEDIVQIGKHLLDGHYATWPYFQTIDSSTNEEWVTKFQAQFGSDRVIGGPMESAYLAVHLWAKAVEAAGTTETSAVRNASYGLTFEAPAGPVTLQNNHHLRQSIHIGKALDNGLFEIVWSSETLIDPNPWSQQISSSKGYICNWNTPEGGERYRPEAAASQGS